jgi:hypothetical protein
LAVVAWARERSTGGDPALENPALTRFRVLAGAPNEATAPPRNLRSGVYDLNIRS